MKSLTTFVALCIGLISASSANAALESRLGGLAVYDTDLNLTWLANATASGNVGWSQANAWAAGLRVNGISGWRLPTTLQPDATCGLQWSGGVYGTQTGGFNCTGSEMGHLFYTELGGVAYWSISARHNTNYSLFQNLTANSFWSGTEYAPSTGNAWYFRSGYDNFQYYTPEQYGMYALAVRSGDVAAVPVPGAAWLLGSGLLGLVSVARRKVA